MGTDVYLEWDNMTEEEEKARITGFSINAGRVGYLRASIGMVSENTVLRCVFPEEFWEGGDGLPYDFKNRENLMQLATSVRMYLLYAMLNRDMPADPKAAGNLAFWSEAFAPIMKEVEKDGGEWHCSGVTDIDAEHDRLPHCVTWANSLYDFYLLGWKMQEKGRNPKVYISW